MGELADHINRLVDDVDDYPTPTWAYEFAELVNSVADLEQRCAMMEASASMASATFAEVAAPLRPRRSVPDADDEVPHG